MFLKPSAKDGDYRVVISKGDDEIVIESFQSEADARDYFEKATAEDTFLFQLGAGGEYSVSLEIPETVWRPIAKRMVLADE